MNKSLSDLFANLGQTASSVVTALKTPSASDLIKASNQQAAKQQAPVAVTSSYLPWIIGGGLVLGLGLVLALVFGGGRGR